MTRRQFRMLGSGGSTPTDFRIVPSTRRKFRPLPGGGGAVPCNKVNFKMFDFATGGMLWQRLLFSPRIATDGTIYAVKFSDAALPISLAFNSGVAAVDKTLTLANRSGSSVDYWTYSIDRYAAIDGALLGNSGVIGLTTIPSTPITGNGYHEAQPIGMKASAYQVNADGNIQGTATGAPFFAAYVVEPNTTATAITYYIPMVKCKNANLVFTDSDANVCTVDVTDSAATIEAALTSDFGASVTSVTVTGDKPNTSLLTIVIDWADNTKYLNTIKLDHDTGFYASFGNAYLFNLRTGIRGNSANTGGVSSSYSGAYAWQDSGNIFRKGADPSNATIRRYESWDTSTDPWTLDWSEKPFVSKTAIVPDETVMFDIELIAAGGICAISFPLTAASTDILVNRMSIISWNDDGTGETEYHNSGNNFTGYYPQAVSVEDGGTDMMCHAVAWRDADVLLAHGGNNTQAVYGSELGEPVVRWSSGGSYAKSDAMCVGDFAFYKSAGFDDARAAFVFLSNLAIIPETIVETSSSIGSGLIQKWVAEEPSGMINLTTLVAMDRWVQHYDLLSRVNSLADDATEWRLRLVKGATTEQTAWMAPDATIGELNTELDAVFGASRNGDQNVTATVETATSPVAVPLYKQGLSLECLGAQSTADATDMETPAIFTDSGTVTTVRGSMPECYLDVQSFGKAVTTTLGARFWADGLMSWSRNFNASGAAKGIRNAQLHGGQLYVLSVPQCEEVGELVIEAVETTTPPYDSSSEAATFDITIRNYTGLELTSLVLHASHDGFGSLSSPTMLSTLAIGASSTISLTYTTNLDVPDVTLTVYVTGTKPDTTTATSNTLVLTVEIDGLIVDPPAGP